MRFSKDEKIPCDQKGHQGFLMLGQKIVKSLFVPPRANAEIPLRKENF